MDAGAGRDSTWRRTTATAAAAGGGGGEDEARGRGGMESPVVPLELYDSARAKIEANLRWLFAKAYGIGKVTFVLLKASKYIYIVTEINIFFKFKIIIRLETFYHCVSCEECIMYVIIS